MRGPHGQAERLDAHGLDRPRGGDRRRTPCLRRPAAPPADHDEESEREGAIAIEEVNRLVALGAIRPLSEVLAAAQKRFPGELIDVNLLRRHGRYVYEIEILRGGRRVEVYVDAATLQLRGKE